MVSQDAQKKFGLLHSACRAWLSSPPHPTNTPGAPLPQDLCPCPSLHLLRFSPGSSLRWSCTNITSSRRPSLTTWSPFIISSRFFT